MVSVVETCRLPEFPVVGFGEKVALAPLGRPVAANVTAPE